ncbi:MAG: VWA domain-containing protein [Acidimicrobiales bacterium]|nr:VWA domain-containing protein [Acidimicrobiales bacterium]
MSFANPAGLWFLLALLPVIALHLLKPRRTEAVVSSAMMWQDETVGATAASPWQRLPPTLLLFLQLLLVVLGALLLADPVTTDEAGLAEHTVVVIDTSASMGAIDGSPDRLADAKDEAIGLLDELPRGGQVSLVTAGPTARVLTTATTDFDAYRASVRGIRLSDGPSDLVGAMTLADGLETPDVRLGIVLISDGIHSAVEQAALPTGVTHRLVGSGDVNHAITDLAVERTSEGLLATATLQVTGGGSVSAPLRFDVDGLTQAVIDVAIDPGTPTVTQVNLPEGEQLIARLGGDDLLAIDNTGYALARTRSDITVSVVGDASPFLTALLDSLSGVDVVDPAVTVPDVSIFVGVAIPDEITRPFIALAPPSGAPGVEVVGVVDNPAVTFVTSGDPLLAGLDLSRLRIATSQRVEAPTAEVLVAAEGAPLILRGQRSGIPFLYQSFAITDSTLPLELAFPVLGQRMLEELSGAVNVPSSLLVGDPIIPPAGRGVVIESPNGTRRDRSAGAGAVIADRPGFWIIEPIDGAPRTVAVSLGDAESNLDPLPIAPTDPRPLRPGEEAPSSERSWRWLVAIAAVVVAVWEWVLSRRRLGVPAWQWRAATLLRVTAAALLIAALLGAAIPIRSNEIATVFVLDRSDSVGRTGVTEGRRATDDAAAAAPDDGKLGVVVAADGARIEQLLVSADRSSGFATATIDTDRSDLASGLRLAGALLPEDARKRVVIVSDGRATSGDAESEAQALGERGIAVEYILLEPSAGADAAVLSLNAPSTVNDGALIPIEGVIESTTEQPALVTLLRDGEPIGSADVLLQPGNNRVSFTDTPDETGLAEYAITVDTSDDARPQNNLARTTVDVDGPAEVLIVEGSSDAGDALAQALQSNGILVEVISAPQLPALNRLIGYDSIVLADVPTEQLAVDQVESLTTATRQLGRGLLTIGGPQTYGMGGYRDSALEEVLPVISDVLDPKRQRKVAQVMALDTSESMGECHCAEGFEGQDRLGGGVTKTAIARAGAARAIANLGANDEIGVLAIDTNEEWLIDLQELPPDDVIDSGLAKATPSGNTDLSNTLPTAAAALRESNAGLKHVILFTDGFTSQASLTNMRGQAADLLAEGITVSVVATGEGAARQLAAVAEAGGGRFYPGRDLTKIPEILVQESIVASRQFINEGEFLPIVTDRSPVVDSLVASPPLLGYVATTPKNTARTILRIGPEEDPLLSTWQVGLGRASSWTSDANTRWSKNWVSWDQYASFWTDVVRDTFPITTDGTVRTIVDGDVLRIRAETEAGLGRVEAVVTSPTGSQGEVRLREISPGVYEGTAAADGSGIYAVGVEKNGDEAVGSSIASVSYAAEYQPGAADEALLRRISEASGGRGAITPDQAFDDEGLVSGRRSVSLAGWFLLASALAWLAAAVLSRLWLGRRSIPAVKTTTSRPTAAPVSETSQAAPSFAPPEPQPEPDPVEVSPASASTVNELLKARREKRSNAD